MYTTSVYGCTLSVGYQDVLLEGIRPSTRSSQATKTGRPMLDSDRYGGPGKKEEEREESGDRSEQQLKQRDERIGRV